MEDGRGENGEERGDKRWVKHREGKRDRKGEGIERREECGRGYFIGKKMIALKYIIDSIYHCILNII